MSLINVTSTTIPLAIKVFANSLRSPLVSIRTASSLEETTEKNENSTALLQFERHNLIRNSPREKIFKATTASKE